MIHGDLSFWDGTYLSKKKAKGKGWRSRWHHYGQNLNQFTNANEVCVVIWCVLLRVKMAKPSSKASNCDRVRKTNKLVKKTAVRAVVGVNL
jgi:hypothetical protein